MTTIILKIDGYTVETHEGKSVLQSALDAGIYIPHICFHEDLKPAGACRLCIVEIEGVDEAVLSCHTLVQDNMIVTTRSPRLRQMRRLAAELLLTAHPSDCTSCPKYLKCELQSMIQYLEVTDQRIRKRVNLIPKNTVNPLVLHDMSRCILCGRCVRACTELRGVGALTFIRKEGKVSVGIRDGLSLAEAGCKFCGACIEVCPTGSIRDQEGVIKAGVNYKEALVPCQGTCPAGIDIPRFVRFINKGDCSAALSVIREKVPFPSVLGHICVQNCEPECRRGKVNDAVSIKNLKRFAAAQGGDGWKAKAKQLAATGRKVAIIGAGPAGLTAAYYLAKLGHSVTVFEALPYAGGMMRFGIPRYRLPWSELDKEIGEIEALGVEIKTNVNVNSINSLLNDGYNAVLAAVGAHNGVKLPLKGQELDGVLINTTFLRQASLGEEVQVGDRVVVLGGGNVAFDCAGVARRLGAKDVHIACLEARHEMKASAAEIAEALEEGVHIHPAVTFHEIVGENGKVTGVICSKVSNFHFDETGHSVIECEASSEHVIVADTVIFAVGQRPDIDATFGLQLGGGNRIQVSPDTLATSVAGVFAAGDAVTGTVSVIEAIVAGRKAAAAIDKYLGGTGNIDENLAPVTEPEPYIGYEKDFARRSRCVGSLLPIEERLCGFEQVDLGLTQEQAHKEAGRCLQCDLRLKLAKPKFWGEYTNR